MMPVETTPWTTGCGVQARYLSFTAGGASRSNRSKVQGLFSCSRQISRFCFSVQELIPRVVPWTGWTTDYWPEETGSSAAKTPTQWSRVGSIFRTPLGPVISEVAI